MDSSAGQRRDGRRAKGSGHEKDQTGSGKKTLYKQKHRIRGRGVLITDGKKTAKATPVVERGKRNEESKPKRYGV